MSEINVNIKCSNSDKADVQIELSATVLKEKAGEALYVPASRQRLIYKGRVLKDESTLESYEVQDGHTVHMVKGASAAAASTATARSTTTPSTLELFYRSHTTASRPTIDRKTLSGDCSLL